MSNNSNNFKLNTNKSGNGMYNKSTKMASNQYNNFKESSTAKKILIVLIIIFVIWLIVYWIVKAYRQKDDDSKYSPIIVSSPIDAWVNRSIIEVPPPPEGIEITMSVWIYMKNMEYKLGKWKNILWLGQQPKVDSDKLVGGKSYPAIMFYPLTNSIKFQTTTSSSAANESCDIKNIPFNKWVHIAYVLNNRTVDIYVDGKLERSCVLKGLPKIDSNPKLGLTLDKGFYGKVGRTQYFARAIEPHEVSNIYEKGPLGSTKYKVNFFVDGKIVETESTDGYNY